MLHAAGTRFAQANDTWQVCDGRCVTYGGDSPLDRCLVETCVDKHDRTPHALPPDSLGTPAPYPVDAAGASIAQVHRARLKSEDGNPGDWVAVKVQKPAVAKQMEPDLAAFRMVMWMYEHWIFEMPVYFVVGMCPWKNEDIHPLTLTLTRLYQ